MAYTSLVRGNPNGFEPQHYRCPRPQSSAENTLMTMARLLQQMGIQQHLQAFDLEEQDTPSIGMGGESQRVSQEERKGQASHFVR